MYQKRTGIIPTIENNAFRAGCQAVATVLSVATGVADVMQRVSESGIRKDIQDLAGIYRECASFLITSVRNGGFVEALPLNTASGLRPGNADLEIMDIQQTQAAE